MRAFMDIEEVANAMSRSMAGFNLNIADAWCGTNFDRLTDSLGRVQINSLK